jgi:hypothetical protein
VRVKQTGLLNVELTDESRESTRAWKSGEEGEVGRT